MYRHVAKAFVSRASANPTRYPGGPGPDLIDRLGSAYPLDGMAALDILAAWLPGTQDGGGKEPPPEIGLDRAVASFLEDFEEFNRKLDTQVARALAVPRPAEPIGKPETPKEPTALDAVPARPDEPPPSDQQPAPASAEKPHRPADVVKISDAAPHLRWDEPDDDAPHLERIKRAVALARREAQGRAARQATGAVGSAPPVTRPESPTELPQAAPAERSAEQPPQRVIESPPAALVESRVEPPPLPVVQPAVEPQPEPDVADVVQAEPARGGSGSSIAALVGLASLLAGGVALWLAVARQTELEQLEATLADQPGPVTTAARAPDNLEALQVLAARMERMRERIAALENSTTDEGRNPAQAAALTARLADLEAAMQALKSLPAPKRAGTAAPATVLPAAKAPPSPAPALPARP